MAAVTPNVGKQPHVTIGTIMELLLLLLALLLLLLSGMSFRCCKKR